MIMFRVARGLQLIGLILIPVAVAGNLVEFVDAKNALTLKDSLVLSGAGVIAFFFGWWLQQRLKPG